MVFPMRSQLIALARNIAAEGISFAQILTILDFARYLLPAGLILMLMILALMHRDPLRVCGYYGASLASTGIVDLVCVFLIHTLHLSDKVKLVNTDYARVVSTFLRQLRSPFFWIGFLALLIGYAMIALLYHRFFKLQGAQVG